MKKVLVSVILGLLMSVFSFADSYDSIQYHFSFTNFQRWKEIPKSKIDERARQIADTMGTKFVNYITGFQESGIQDFGYPNMLLQYHDLQGHKLTWNDFVDIFGNVNLSSEINNSGYKSFIEDFNTTAPLIDRSKKMIIHNTESTVTGVGILRSVIIVHLGKNGIVQINITIPKNNYNKYSTAINNIIETLKFDYGYTFIDSVSEVQNNMNKPQYTLASSEIFDKAIERGKKGLYSGFGLSIISLIVLGSISIVKKIIKKDKSDNNSEKK
jgi:hypothetical protein